MQQANKSEQLELDELLSDIYRGIERLPDEPATALEQSHESYNHYNDDYHDRHFNHHTVSFATTTRRNSKELTERQIKEKAMIEELKRNFRSGALTLRNSFKSSSRDKQQQQQNNTNTTNQSNLKAPSRYNTTNNRSTSRSPTPNRVTFMRQHSDLTNYRLPPSTKALNDQQQQQTTNNMSKQPSTHYTINQQLIIPNGTTSNATKQQSQQSILTSSSNTMQPQQKAIYANPHNSLLQHKRQQQYNLNQCSMREFDELDSLLNSLKITNTTNTNFMNNSRNNNIGNNSNGMQLSNNSTNRQQNLDSTVPLYAKVQKNIPIQSNNHQNYHYKTTNNDASRDQQQSNTRIIPVHAAKDGQVIHTTHNNTTSGYYNPNNNNNNGNSNNGHGNNEDDNNDDGNYLRHTTIENNQHQPIYGHYHKQNQQYHSESQDPPFDILPSMEYYQLLSKFNTVKNDYWYKPKMSRETAINLLRDKPPGTFIVRDSTSFNGAYGLAVKVAKLPRNVLTNANLRNTNATLPNELIRHFLIESTTKGVRLKGYANEPVFSSLPALVYQHSITELALPCKLSIPRADVEDPKFAEKQRRFYEEVMAEKADSTKGIYGKSGTLGGMRNYEGVPIHSEHRIIFDRI